MQILHDPHFDFLGKTKLWVGISLAMLALSVGWMATRGLHYGVEFSGGTQLIVRFQNPPAVDKVREAVDKVTSGGVIQSYDDPSKHQVLIRVAGANEVELSKHADAVLQSLATSYPDNRVVESSTDIVGPIVGSELRQKAIQLTVLGLMFQLIYIGFRFKGAIWGTAATLAVFHDVVVTLGLLAMFGYEITLNTIAALLTLVGYSVNDTIVVFDRVRENLRQRRKEPLPRIINDSINQTLSRTLISSGTTFLTVLGLFIFGGEVLRGFAFAMVVGIVVGTYSSIYIASPIVVFWQGLMGGKGKAAGNPTGNAGTGKTSSAARAAL
jgi:preprotein translocase subunit SecF